MRRWPESMTNICVSWNTGHCTFLGTCRFRHSCATCQQPHMVRDCAATPAHLEYQEPSLSSQPETPLLMWQSNGAYDIYLIVLHIMLTYYLYPYVHNVVWNAIYVLTHTFTCYYICALCNRLVHVVILITIYVHMVTLWSLLW